MTNMKKNYFIIFSLLVLLTSCSIEMEKVESPSNQIIQGPVVFNYHEQEFKIINYYQESLNFLGNAKKEPNNLDVLYRQSVIEELKNNGFGYDELSDWMFTTPTDLEALKESVNTLIDKQVLLNESIKEALVDSANLLPGGNKTVHILPARPEFFLHDRYVLGVVWNENSILIVINPSFLEEELKYTIAHEYHHTFYNETVKNRPYDLLENIIVEGKATMFQKMIYPDMEVPGISTFSTQDDKVWNIFMDNLESTDLELRDDFRLGNQRKGIPPWSTYNIGYQVMESLLEENPNLSIEEWTQISSKDILEKSKFKVK